MFNLRKLTFATENFRGWIMTEWHGYRICGWCMVNMFMLICKVRFANNGGGGRESCTACQWKENEHQVDLHHRRFNDNGIFLEIHSFSNSWLLGISFWQVISNLNNIIIYCTEELSSCTFPKFCLNTGFWICIITNWNDFVNAP